MTTHFPLATCHFPLPTANFPLTAGHFVQIHLYTVAQEMAVREWKDASVVVTQPPSDKGSKTPSCPSSGLGSVPSSALGTGSGSGSVPSSALGMEGPELFVPSLWQVDAERDLSVAMEDEVDELQEVMH